MSSSLVFKFSKMQQNMMEKGAERDDSSSEAVDKVIAQGTNAGDLKELQDAGIYTCIGLMMNTKALSNIKGLSDAKVDKICEAAERIVQIGVTRDLMNLKVSPGPSIRMDASGAGGKEFAIKVAQAAVLAASTAAGTEIGTRAGGDAYAKLMEVIKRRPDGEPDAGVEVPTPPQNESSEPQSAADQGLAHEDPITRGGIADMKD